MASHEHTSESGSQFDPARSSTTPDVNQQQSTQGQERQGVDDARAAGERVVDQAQAQRQKAAEQARARLEQATDTAKKTADQQKNRAASTMNRAAGTVRQKSQQLPGGQTTQQMAGIAADKMDEAAGYLYQTNSEDVLRRIQNWTRRHPTQALVLAGLIGLYLGRKISS